MPLQRPRGASPIGTPERTSGGGVLMSSCQRSNGWHHRHSRRFAAPRRQRWV